MRDFKRLYAAVLLAVSSLPAQAQDGGNLVAALDHAVANADSVLQDLLFADATGSVQGAGSLVSDLLVDVTDGTPLAPTLTPVLDQTLAPLAQAALPVTSLAFPSALLAGGIPLVDGERIVVVEEQLSLGQSLRDAGIPLEALDRLLRLDLLGPGDGDSGGLLLPVFGGHSAEAEVLQATLADLSRNGMPLLNAGGLMLVEEVLAAGQAVVGGSLALQPNQIPLVGVLLGGGAGLGGLLGGSLVTGAPSQGLRLINLPLPLSTLEPATAIALQQDRRLPGLP